ncbi:hypothetical protein L3Q82_024212, partial [Scortum barcoo]
LRGVCYDNMPSPSVCLPGNGYIEGKELENFFRELEMARRGAGVDPSNPTFREKMKEFMQKFDKNKDGRIEMSELAQILPTEENFLLCFRQFLSSSAEFMAAWRRYDTDRSGYIEANELKGFLSDLLEKANRHYDDQKLQEYTQTILRMFDLNGDGKLGLSEMARLLPVQENFLLKFEGVKLTTEQFNAIFAYYDKDGNGYIDEHELDDLLVDLYQKNKKVRGGPSEPGGLQEEHHEPVRRGEALPRRAGNCPLQGANHVTPPSLLLYIVIFSACPAPLSRDHLQLLSNIYQRLCCESVRWSDPPTYRRSRVTAADLADWFLSDICSPRTLVFLGRVSESSSEMSAAVQFAQCGSVLVTGASRGLGLQIVDSLASGGFSPRRIIAATRKPGSAQKLQELAEKHPNIHIVALDVVNQESIEKCVEEVSQLVQDEGLNCLINNAGINVVADFHTVTAEKMIENFHTNAVAPLMVTKLESSVFLFSRCQAFLPPLKKAASREGAGGAGSMSIQRAAVINITSLLGSVELNWGEQSNNLKWYPYRTSKSALNMVSRCMAIDLEPDGILCMAIHPGWVRTDMGGAEAPLSPEESTASILSVIGGLTEKDHGSFLNFTGETLPW